MPNLPLPALELVSVKRTVPFNGSPSSQDYNDFQNETVVDLASLTSFVNGTLIPLLQVLPALAASAGLEARAINTDSTDQSALCYNAKTATPLTISQSIKYLQTLFSSQQNTILDLSSQISVVQAQLSSTNQNNVSLAMQNFQTTLNNLVAQITAMQTEISLIQSGGSGGGSTPSTFQYADSTPNTTLDFSLGTGWKVTLTCATSFTLENAQPGASVTVIVVQNATGGWPVAWPSNAPGAPQPGLNAGQSTVYTFTFDGTNYIPQSAVVN